MIKLAGMHGMQNDKREYIFGPVPSRRLGRSLGIDLVEFKTCSYDCIYCQLGCTTSKTITRREWVPMDMVLEQLKKKLGARPDYITLSGSGEPTLFSPLSELISCIKNITDIPLAVLTNGSLLYLPKVQNALKRVDLVIPSLDACDEDTFQKVNRPHRDITFANMLNGLIEFRRQFKGRYWLEVFLLADINTSSEQIQKFQHHIAAIKPDKVQVNTVSRPPAESYAKTVPLDVLTGITAKLYHNAEVIADYHHVHQQTDFATRCSDVMVMLQRRPCSVDDIASGLALHRNEVVKYIEELSVAGKITSRQLDGKVYYQTDKI